MPLVGNDNLKWVLSNLNGVSPAELNLMNYNIGFNEDKSNNISVTCMYQLKSSGYFTRIDFNEPYTFTLLGNNGWSGPKLSGGSDGEVISSCSFSAKNYCSVNIEK